MKISTKIILIVIFVTVATLVGTFGYSGILNLRERSNLAVLVEKDRILLNPYGIIPVNPQKYPQRDFNASMAFAKFLLSEEGQNIIANFKKNGETIFNPIAHNFTAAHILGFPNQEKEIEWYSEQTISANLNFSQPLLLATTTSTYESGLLDYLIPPFEDRYNIKVHAISVGTGRAIELAKRGDADLVLVHSKELEESFVKEGYGVHRVGVMYNDFVLIGPQNDPVGIAGITNATEAFMRIGQAGAEGKAIFISRADKSGTHQMELKIWAKLGIQPSKGEHTWYLEAGASMATVLRITNEKRAYTLTDRATWLSKKEELYQPISNGFTRAIELITTFNPEVVNITLLTLATSGTATLLGSAIGIPLGAYLGWSRSLTDKKPLINLMNIFSRNIVYTFMGLPPVLVGLVVYLLLSSSGPLSPFQLLFTPTAMILAQLIMVVPITAGVTLSAVSSVDKAVRERALSLGATESQATLTVLREARTGMFTAIVAAFGAAISEVGGIIIVGGNIRWYTRVLTTAILYETELGNFETAIALGIVLLSLAFTVNLILTYLQQKGVKR